MVIKTESIYATWPNGINVALSYVRGILFYSRGILTRSGELTLLADVGETYFGGVTLLTLNIYVIIVR